MTSSDRPETELPSDAVAIVGMALRVPHAESLEEFWDIVLRGTDTLTRLDRRGLERLGTGFDRMADKRFVAAKPMLEGVECFDEALFGFTADQAEITDPAHRLFLECVWAAMEHAGESPDEERHCTGVFGGVESSYLAHNLYNSLENSAGRVMSRRLGNQYDYFTARVAYEMGFTGPAFTSVAACATSLLGVHLARQSLLMGRCSRAVVGGAQLELPNLPFSSGGVDGMLSRQGRVRPFDADADGTVFGTGVGAAVLKRLPDALADGNRIYGLIRGTGFCNDGNPTEKQSFVAPTRSGQVKVMREAFEVAGIDPKSIAYVECHGTGTLLGDPTEIESLTEVFGVGVPPNSCAIGSVKGNVGHLGAAAGIVSLIKTCLILGQAKIPPIANFEHPNPHIDFSQTPFYVAEGLIDWPGNHGPRRASVSAFGFGGANAHAIVESFDAPADRRADPGGPALRMLPLSAQSPAALRRRQVDLADYLEDHPDVGLHDVAHTLQSGRRHLAQRTHVVVDTTDREAAVVALRGSLPVRSPRNGQRPVVFLFPGMGAQQLEMGLGLYRQEALFREIVDDCAEFLAPRVGFDVRDSLYPAHQRARKAAEDNLRLTAIAQPALFVIEYALARQLGHWGLMPDMMLGHSIGEVTSACLAGVFSMEDALRLVAARSRLLQQCAPGAMLAVLLPAEELQAMLPRDLDLAVYNSPVSNVVAGPPAVIARFARRLDKQSIRYREVRTTHAFHSRLVDPILPAFRQALAGICFHAPVRSLVSNVTGQPWDGAELHDADYWVRHLRQPVRFSKALQVLLADENALFVEVGPGTVLKGFVDQHDAKRETVSVLARAADALPRDAHRHARDALGEAWSRGARCKLHDRPSLDRCKVSLPTYPFQRRHFWRDVHADEPAYRHRYDLPLYETGWVKTDDEESSLLPPGTHWLILGNASGLSEELADHLPEASESLVYVLPGRQTRKLATQRFRVAHTSPLGFQKLLQQVSLDDQGRLRIVHCWTLAHSRVKGDQDAFAFAHERGYLSLLALLQAAHALGIADCLDIIILTTGLSLVEEAQDVLRPEQSVLMGPVRVAPQEIPGLTMRCVDLACDANGAPVAGLVEMAIREIRRDSSAPVTALRSSGRFIEEVFPLPELRRSRPVLRFGGTVFITGGLGGLGLEMANHLYRTRRARLLLASRRRLPSRADWPRIAAEDSDTGRTLAGLLELEAAGASVEVMQVDVADRPALSQALAEVRSRYGAIHGVVHAAGVLDDGPLLYKGLDLDSLVFQSKVQGAYNLEALFGVHDLDMMVYFSSVASVRPVMGQVDYAAANAVLDALARRRKAAGGRACAIAWGPWRDVGMAWQYLADADADDASDGADATTILDTDSTEHRRTEHSVLSDYARDDAGNHVFYGSLVPGEHWITTEHLITNRGVISGTTIVEMYRAAYCVMNADVAGIEISRLAFVRPFVVDASTEYELRCCPVNDRYKCEMHIRSAGDNLGWQMVSSATLEGCDGPPPLSPAITRGLGAVGRQAFSPCGQLAHGPRWHCEWAHAGDDQEMFARIRLPKAFHGEVSDFGLHPALLDRSLHHIVEQLFDDLRLPFACESLRIYGDLGPETLVYRVPSADDTLASRFLITDPDGRLLVDVRNWSMREFSPRLMPEKTSDSPVVADNSDWRLVLAKPGLLDSFESQPFEPGEPKPGEIRISVKAVGLNFRDVLAALGQLPEGDPSRQMIGSECSGVVQAVGPGIRDLKVGDRVLALANDSLAGSVTVKRHFVAPLPIDLSFTEGAGIPITYLTVYHALERLTPLQAGERILIHSATGGVGLAAVQLAQRIGAEIFATAGSERKRDYLRQLGIEHVMDSRSLDFVDQIGAVTAGEGVDVVLNALAGEFIDAGLSVLRPFGRFVEIGKRDIYSDRPLGLYPFRNNLSYFGVDLGQLGIVRPDVLSSLFNDLMERFANGELKPSPTQVFPLTEVSRGFEFMARAEHIGKVVFLVKSNQSSSEQAEQRFRQRFGHGIHLQDGLATYDRLLGSDETPACVVAVGDPIGIHSGEARYWAQSLIARPVNTPYRDPTNSREQILKQIFEKSIGFSPIGVDDDFVAMGGDSVKAIMIQAAIEEEFEVEFSLPLIFEHSTISALALHLESVIVSGQSA